MSFEVDKNLGCLNRKDKVNVQQVSSFKNEGCSLVITMIQKLFERTPLSSLHVRACSIFNPSIITEKTSSFLMQRLKLLLEYLIECRILSTTESDKITYDFNSLLDSDLKKYHLVFQQFDRSK